MSNELNLSSQIRLKKEYRTRHIYCSSYARVDMLISNIPQKAITQHKSPTRPPSGNKVTRLTALYNDRNHATVAIASTQIKRHPLQ